MLNINQLHKEIEKRESRKNVVYQKILEKCFNRIISVNQKSDDCYCIFVVPTFVFGVPLYDVANCVIFIMKDLINRGFKVNYTHPNLLLINWMEKPKTVEVRQSNNFRLINDTSDNSLIYHPTDINSLEFKTDNLFGL